MKKNKIKVIACITLILLAIATIYFYTNDKMPINEPRVTVKYSGKIVVTNKGEHNWFNPKVGGNSYLAGPAYDLGINTESLLATPEGKIEVLFQKAPTNMYLNLWGKDELKSSSNLGSSKKYEFTLPKNKGEYIFEVYGYWSETYNTSTVFRVKVE